MTRTSVAESLQSSVRALGARFDPEVLAATRALYRPHIPAGPGPALGGISYGPHERHRLDVYLPAGRPQGVLVYVHGGGFVGGDKDLDGVFYRNVGQALNREGFAVVAANYRRAPECSWPSGARDVQGAVQWVHANMHQFKAGTLPVFVMGQSAGASHVASWLFDDAARAGALPPTAGVLLMSGFYRARHPLTETIAAYFGTDPECYEQRSPLTHVKPVQAPLWLGVAEFDPGSIASHTFELAQAIASRNGRSPSFQWLPGHNHVSTVLSIGSPHQDAGMEILRFLRAQL